MDKILESKYELRRAELLEKYDKRSKQHRKRVKANGWITVNKLPVDFPKRRRRRRPPKIDDDDEIESAVSSIDMIHCPTNNLTDNQCKENNKLTHPPSSVLDDLDVAGIDDNLLIDCLLTDIDELNFILDSEDFDPNKFDQQQQQFQYLIGDSTQVVDQSNDLRTTKDLDILSEIINDLNYVPENDDQNFNNFHLNSFETESPQESILSSSSPFPASMLSPSIASTSPDQHQHQQQQPHPSEDHKVDDVSSASSPSQSPPRSPQPIPTPSPPSPCSMPTLTSSPPPSQPPLQPSYGKDIFQMLEDANQQNESETSDESELDD